MTLLELENDLRNRIDRWHQKQIQRLQHDADALKEMLFAWVEKAREQYDDALVDLVIQLPTFPENANGHGLKKVTSGLDDEKRKIIEDTLNECYGNRAEAARMLGMSTANMRYYAKKFGINGKKPRWYETHS